MSTPDQIPRWQQSLRDMSAEWAALGDRGAIAPAAAVRSPSAPYDTDHWEQAVAAMRAEQVSLIAEGSWFIGPRDLLGVIGRSRREVVHSAILAWLLDPTAPHGFGAELLRRLLRRVAADAALTDGSLRTVAASCEVSRSNSRADIVVRADDLTLVVECKIDAIEGEHQCDRLYDDFGEDPGAVFVFLTTRGDSPSTATGDARVAFHPLSWRDVLEDLCALMTDAWRASAPPALAAVDAYRATLEAEFS